MESKGINNRCSIFRDNYDCVLIIQFKDQMRLSAQRNFVTLSLLKLPKIGNAKTSPQKFMIIKKNVQKWTCYQWNSETKRRQNTMKFGTYGTVGWKIDKKGIKSQKGMICDK
uniref:Uncharacterized protein n=1 Tax=Micrurus corallinus TaxID=54390 RepID=A0A2D4GNL7_MICCO